MYFTVVKFVNMVRRYLIYTMDLKKENIKSDWTTKTDYNERECVETSVFTRCSYLMVLPYLNAILLICMFFS